jgi:hypothetical protein
LIIYLKRMAHSAVRSGYSFWDFMPFDPLCTTNIWQVKKVYLQYKIGCYRMRGMKKVKIWIDLKKIPNI